VDCEQQKTLLELDVANLTVRLNESRKELAKARRALRRKRVPVLVRVDANGDVSVYARDADVEVVTMPRDVAGPKAMTLAETWVDLGLPERHRDLHMPGYCVATVNSRACRSVTETYEAAQTQAAHEDMNKAISNLKGKENAPTKSQTKANDLRRTKTP
jgi:hypothetical protein